MHELAICQSVLRQVVVIAESHRAGQVKTITLRIGPLAGVEPGLLLAAFPLVAAGTRCQSAQIEIKTIGVRVECQLCGASSGARANRLLCATCGTWQVTLLSGDEMQIDSIELAAMEPRETRERADV
jgi:hydrogenase nickel incorporation protein HypA/HybF